MKSFINRIQKDLNLFQKTIQKEGEVLVSRVKTAAQAKNLNVERIETMVEAQINKFEPALEKFMSEVSKNAKKAGFDISSLEKRVASATKAAKSKLKTKKTPTKKKKTTAKKATAKKTASRPTKTTSKAAPKKAKTSKASSGKTTKTAASKATGSTATEKSSNNNS